MHRACGGLILSAILLSGVPGLAQEPEKRQLAQSLFERGRKLMEDGKFSEACPLFQESQRLDPGGGTLLNLALCHEKEGRLATAWVDYSEALSAAIRDGREDRKALALERRAALADRVPQMSLALPDNVDENALRISLDGVEVPRVSWRGRLPVDPGSHVLRTEAAGYHPLETRFEAREGQAVAVRLGPLQPAAPEPEAPPPRATPPAVAPLSPCTPGQRRMGDRCVDGDQPETRVSTASWIVGGVGVAALGTAALTGVLALRADADAEDGVERAGCVPDRNFCKDPSALAGAESDADRARSLAWVSTGALAVGVGALAVAWLLPREADRTAVRLTPSVGAREVSVQLRVELPSRF